MKIIDILSNIDADLIALPEFQRGYVWNREQVKGLIESLYRKHPVGSLLVWITSTESTKIKGGGPDTPGTVKLLLDGQQRVTSLYGIIRNRPPRFFNGDVRAFTDLYFNLQDESFEFYGPVKMKDNPSWISLTEIMQKGAGQLAGYLFEHPALKENFPLYLERINAIDGIKNIDVHIEEIAGEDKTVDVVVDIFNRVNSGGTKLSKGDLALARICVGWSEAREQMQGLLGRWKCAGFNFQLDWLLRCITTVTTGEAYFSSLKDIDPASFRQGLAQTEKYVAHMINTISGLLGLDHDRVLGSRYSFPLLVRYLHQRGGKFGDHIEMNKVLYWYVHSFLWGRYAGSTESVLSKDLAAIADGGQALVNLIENLRQNRGDLRVTAGDFAGWSTGARFYPLLYMLTRVHHARDLCSGIPLNNSMLGKFSQLHVHHIFPKAQLYKARQEYSRAQVNALANFCFLTQECNLEISDRQPEEYLPKYEAMHPGVLKSQWIPEDPALWRIDRYADFLAARRELLAASANELLDSLYKSTITHQESEGDILDRVVPIVHGGFEDDEEELQIDALSAWMRDRGLPEGEKGYELATPDGTLLANIDLAWPNGVQQYLTQPVALILNEGEEVESLLNEHGYRYFTSSDHFRRYVEDVLMAGEKTNYPSSE